MIDYPIEIDKWRSYFEAGARPSSDEGLAMLDEINRLRAFIQSLDGKTITIRSDGNTFIAVEQVTGVKEGG